MPMHGPVAFHPLNRAMHTPEGYRYSLWCYNRWGMGDFWWEKAAKPRCYNFKVQTSAVMTSKL
jgi:hypothetical protein